MPEILSLVGLADKTNSYPHEISGGEQQRVSVARAFVNHPPLLLADEPTGNIDPETAVGIMQLLVRINRTGTTVVVATHDRDMVNRMRRRVLQLDVGRLVRDERRGGYDQVAEVEEQEALTMRLGFFLGEAFGSMRRNWVMAMAAVITVFISTAILGAVLVTRDNLNQGATSLKNRVMIEVFIKDEATDEQKAGARAEDPGHPRGQELQVHHQGRGARALPQALRRAHRPEPAHQPAAGVSYEIQVKDANQVDAVAAKFFDDPTVDNDPGTHNGVKYARETVRKMLGTINLDREAACGSPPASSRRRRAAHQHHGAPQHLRAAARGRDHAPRGRHQLVHPLAVRARGLHHRPHRRDRRRRLRLAVQLGARQLDQEPRHQLPRTSGCFSMWWQGGSWPLGLLPTLAILGAVLGALGSLVALRRYLKT